MTQKRACFLSVMSVFLSLSACTQLTIYSEDGKVLLDDHSFGLTELTLVPRDKAQIFKASGYGISTIQGGLVIGFERVEGVTLPEHGCRSVIWADSIEELNSALDLLPKDGSICVVDAESSIVSGKPVNNPEEKRSIQ